MRAVVLTLTLAACGFRSGAVATVDGSGAELDASSDAPVDAVARRCLDGTPMHSGTPCTLTFGDRDGSLLPTTIAETWIADDFPANNLGAEPTIHIDDSPLHIGLLRFDVVAIPLGASLQSAQLSVFGAEGSAQELGSGRIHARVALESWEQGTGNNVIGTPNRTEVSPGMHWAGPNTTPLAATTLAFEIVAPTPNAGETVVDVDLAVLASWVAQPTQNFGLVLTSDNDGAGFDSSESTLTAERPLLTVTFVPP